MRRKMFSAVSPAVTCAADKKMILCTWILLWMETCKIWFPQRCQPEHALRVKHTSFSITTVSACTHRRLTIRPDSHFRISLKKYSDRVRWEHTICGSASTNRKSQLTHKTFKILFPPFYLAINSLFVFVNLCSIFTRAFLFGSVWSRFVNHVVNVREIKCWKMRNWGRMWWAPSRREFRSLTTKISEYK